MQFEVAETTSLSAEAFKLRYVILRLHILVSQLSILRQNVSGQVIVTFSMWPSLTVDNMSCHGILIFGLTSGKLYLQYSRRRFTKVSSDAQRTSTYRKNTAANRH